MTPEHLELLRRLTLNDENTLGDVLGALRGDPSLVDAKAATLAQLAGLIAIGSASSSYRSAIDAAQAAGAGNDEIVAVLVAVAPIVGAAHVSLAAPEVAAALGYDLEPDQ